MARLNAELMMQRCGCDARPVWSCVVLCCAAGSPPDCAAGSPPDACESRRWLRCGCAAGCESRRWLRAATMAALSSVGVDAARRWLRSSVQSSQCRSLMAGSAPAPASAAAAAAAAHPSCQTADVAKPKTSSLAPVSSKAPVLLVPVLRVLLVLLVY